MSTKIKVVCPHCKAEQEEPVGAISTYCHSCKRHIPIQGNRKRKAALTPQNKRVVICRECGYADKIVEEAQSTQCENCSSYLDLRSHIISGKCGQKLVTYGDVTFLPGSSYEGPLVRASKIIVAGKISAILHADIELEVQEGGKISNPFQAPRIRIGPGAEVTVARIVTRTLELASRLRADEVHASENIVILEGGVLCAHKVTTPFIEVQPGGGLLADLTVEPGEINVTVPAPEPDEPEEKDPELV